MREKTLVICGGDREYTDRLGRYISGREGTALRVVCFSDREKLTGYLEKGEADAVLAEEEWLRERPLPGTVRQLVLSEERDAGTEAAPHLYKYQAAEDLFAQILLGMGIPGGEAARRTDARVFGLYSPAGWPEITRLAMAMARQLGREGPSVYVGLNEFSPAAHLCERAGGQDLSDAVYCWRRGRLTEERLERIAGHSDGFDCIPAPANPAELEELTGSAAVGLLETICREGGYACAVADFGGGISGKLPLFESGERNFVLFPDTETGRMQREEYERFWRSVGAGGFLERCELLTLPAGEYRAGKKGRPEEEMDELAKRLLRGAGAIGAGGGEPVWRGD